MKTAKHFIFCVLLLFTAQNGISAEPAQISSNENKSTETAQIENTGEVKPNKDVEVERNIESKKYLAWQQFCLAKNSEAADVRSGAYANAIKYINEAYDMDTERPDTLLLASRIYRSMGGLSYAKSYFSKAAAIYLNKVLQNPESIQANLNAAIILYAGDVRYWDSYEQSKKNAWSYADKVLEVCKNEKKIDEKEQIFLEEARALVFLIKENIAGSNVHFAKAEKLYAGEINQNNAVRIKIIEAEECATSDNNALYQPYALFKEYLLLGKWYWPVTTQTEASKEFLLNCLTGFYPMP